MARINAADWSDTTNKKLRERERDSSLLLLLLFLLPLILPRGSIPFLSFPPLYTVKEPCVCVCLSVCRFLLYCTAIPLHT